MCTFVDIDNGFTIKHTIAFKSQAAFQDHIENTLDNKVLGEETETLRKSWQYEGGQIHGPFPGDLLEDVLRVYPEIKPGNLTSYINDFGPLVHGFLNEPSEFGGEKVSTVIINYSWRFSSQKNVKNAQDSIETWTQALGENGLFYDSIMNWKFW